MRRILTVSLALLLFSVVALCQFRPYGWKPEPPSEQKTPAEDPAEQPGSRRAEQPFTPDQQEPKTQDSEQNQEKPDAIPGAAYDSVSAAFTGDQFKSWTLRQIDGRQCRVSPPLQAPRRSELNHHRVSITFGGRGSVELSLAHSNNSDLDQAIKAKHLHSPFKKCKSDEQSYISSPYKGERFVWLCISAGPDLNVTAVRYTCWRGKDTLYGHVGAYFRFGGSKLPYRLMYPRNYDPGRAYPLVLTVPSSGGIGSNNVKNMEMVGLAGFLFNKYYFDDELACFSVVPELPPHANIPAPYFPKGPLGKPHPLYHPGNFHVNEKGWYTQASLALIAELLGCGELNIDPNRVYFSGFSYGGKGCWEFLKAAPERFAAALSVGGWAIGKPYTEPRGMLLQELAKEVARYKHVPVWIFAGEKDGMSLSSRAVHKELLKQGANAQYTEFPGTDHISSAGKAWGNQKHISWLFQQKRPNNLRSPACATPALP